MPAVAFGLPLNGRCDTVRRAVAAPLPLLLLLLLLPLPEA
jgi:hypothetical protein